MILDENTSIWLDKTLNRSASIFRESRNEIHPISAAKNLLAVNAFGGPDSSSVRHDAQLPYGTLHIMTAQMT